MPDFTIKQGDTAPVLTDTLTYSDGSTVNLTGASVNFVVRQMTANNVLFNKTATITSTSSPATVSYTFTAADTAVAGQYVGNWIVTFSGGSQMTFPTVGDLELTVEENLTTPGGARIVSLGEVKDYLNIPANDRTRDAKLIRFIDQLRPVIENITGPILQRNLSETYDGGSPWISLRYRPVLSVNSVTEYRGPIPYPLQQVPTPDLGTIYSYMFEPPGRIVRRTVGGGQTAFPSGADSVFVTYTAGFAQVPPNVTEACLEMARTHFQLTQQGRPRPGGSQVDDDDPTRPIIGFFVSGKVRELLAPNVRHPSVA